MLHESDWFVSPCLVLFPYFRLVRFGLFELDSPLAGVVARSAARTICRRRRTLSLLIAPSREWRWYRRVMLPTGVRIVLHPPTLCLLVSLATKHWNRRCLTRRALKNISEWPSDLGRSGSVVSPPLKNVW